MHDKDENHDATKQLRSENQQQSHQHIYKSIKGTTTTLRYIVIISVTNVRFKIQQIVTVMQFDNYGIAKRQTTERLS